MVAIFPTLLQYFLLQYIQSLCNPEKAVFFWSFGTLEMGFSAYFVFNTSAGLTTQFKPTKLGYTFFFQAEIQAQSRPIDYV